MTWTDNGHRIIRRQYCKICQKPIHLCSCNEVHERRQHNRSIRKKFDI